MNPSETAQHYFRNSFNCSQSVLAAFGSQFGMETDQCLKLACSFGAGIGRRQMTCGAVTGALMVIGLRYGKASNDDDSKKTETYEKVNQFLGEFEKLNGSLNCKDLLDGLSMSNPEEMEQIRKRNLFVTRCERYVADAVAITEKLL